MNLRIKMILKVMVPQPAKRALAQFRLAAGYAPVNRRLRRSGAGRRLILMATPEHGNLGDHAIACGELAFFQKFFPDWPVVEITGDHYRRQKGKIVKMIRPADVICITGGGFLGSLWPDEEALVQDILTAFPNNQTVILPSTLYYEETENGRTMLHASRQFYRNHRDLTLFLRDAGSLTVARDVIGSDSACQLVLAPDMALFLNRTEQPAARAGVLFCLRDDKEKMVDPTTVQAITEHVSRRGKSIRQTSTVLQRRVTIAERNSELERKLDEFRQAELVITDRLHGMIFAAITSTPCVAMGNTSGKVSGVHAWIRQLNYIHLADSAEAAISAYDQLIQLKGESYDPDLLSRHFQALSDRIRGTSAMKGKS